MDLSLSAAEKAFALQLRDWLAHNVERPDSGLSPGEAIAWGRRWQAKLAEARMVAISWPESVGGRGATPVEVALYNMEYARAGAPQPVNRVGINLAGPTLLAQARPSSRTAGCRRSSTPARSGASCSASPARDRIWRRCRLGPNLLPAAG